MGLGREEGGKGVGLGEGGRWLERRRRSMRRGVEWVFEYRRKKDQVKFPKPIPKHASSLLPVLSCSTLLHSRSLQLLRQPPLPTPLSRLLRAQSPVLPQSTSPISSQSYPSLSRGVESFLGPLDESFGRGFEGRRRAPRLSEGWRLLGREWRGGRWV